MLAFDVKWIDVSANLAAQEQPVFMLERPLAHAGAKAWAGNTEIARVGDFWVPQGPIVGTDTKWALTKVGDHVRIPIVAYKTPTRSIASIFGLGVQIGCEAINSLRSAINVKPADVVMILGQECTDLFPQDAFRCYIGLAIRTTQ